MISTSHDGTIYMVSRNSGEKNYSMDSNRDWKYISWGPDVQDITGRGNSPDNTVFSAVQVTNDELHVTVRTSAYQVIDEYTIKK